MNNVERLYRNLRVLLLLFYSPRNFSPSLQSEAVRLPLSDMDSKSSDILYSERLPGFEGSYHGHSAGVYNLASHRHRVVGV
jgi:hypothetical protein